jgi:regulator of protease activity HflC (stomatin/prohibitin superfamily)
MQPNNNKAVLGIIVAGIIAIVALIVFFGSFTTISPGEQGIVLRLSSINRVVENGFHFKLPMIERVVKINTQVQKEQVSATAASKDLQNVSAEVALNYNLFPDKVETLYSKIGTNYKERIIDPAIQEAIKAATAKYTAEELVTKREQVRNDIKLALTERLTPEYINVTEVSITNFDFSPSFNQAIEAKVTAEQNALAAKNKLEQVKYEAEQKVASAEAEAKSIRLQSDAANNEKYVNLKKLEVQIEFAKKWNGVGCQNNCWGVDAQNPIPFLNVTK